MSINAPNVLTPVNNVVYTKKDYVPSPDEQYYYGRRGVPLTRNEVFSVRKIHNDGIKTGTTIGAIIGLGIAAVSFIKNNNHSFSSAMQATFAPVLTCIMGGFLVGGIKGKMNADDYLIKKNLEKS